MAKDPATPSNAGSSPAWKPMGWEPLKWEKSETPWREPAAPVSPEQSELPPTSPPVGPRDSQSPHDRAIAHARMRDAMRRTSTTPLPAHQAKWEEPPAPKPLEQLDPKPAILRDSSSYLSWKANDERPPSKKDIDPPLTYAAKIIIRIATALLLLGLFASLSMGLRIDTPAFWVVIFNFLSIASPLLWFLLAGIAIHIVAFQVLTHRRKRKKR